MGILYFPIAEILLEQFLKKIRVLPRDLDAAIALAGALRAFEGEIGIIFWVKTTDVENVLLGLQDETLQDRVFRADLPGRQRLGAIAHHHRRFAVAAAIVLPHSLRVSDYAGGRKGRKNLADGKDN